MENGSESNDCIQYLPDCDPARASQETRKTIAGGS